MPTELGYVSDTVDQFVHRVEDRSSLLQMAGHDVEDGRLVEFFEFRHLTFQEFLTAQAMVKGWHRDAKDTDTLADVLEPHFEKEAWHEVIPLAAVLGGKATEMLIKRLTEKTGSVTRENLNEKYTLSQALGNCLADEAAARPETIRAAIRELVRSGSFDVADFGTMLARGRYGKELREESRKSFLAPGATDPLDAGDPMAMVVYWQLIETEDDAGWAKAAEHLVKMLESPERITKCEGCLGIMYLCYRLNDYPDGIRACSGSLRLAGDAFVKTLNSEHKAEQFAATWALVWLGACRVWLPPPELDVLSRLYMLWRQSTNATVQRITYWAIASQPVVSRDVGWNCASVPREELHGILEAFDQLKDETEKIAVLVIAWYLYAP